MTILTALEMRALLGLSPASIGAFNAYRAKYPHAFVIVQEGRAGRGPGGASNAALYEGKAFMKWLKRRKQAEQVLKGE